MIPKISIVEMNDREQPSKNHKMHLLKNRIAGMTDGIDAMKQTIYMILNTERFQYLIYSWNYGIELEDLFGEPVTYACSELQRRITEALTQDERILSVDAFSFYVSVKRRVSVKFTAHTIFGDIDAEKVVNI